MSEHLEDIRSRLDRIAEELADLALDRLQESLAEGADASDERRITRARERWRRRRPCSARPRGPARSLDDPASGGDLPASLVQ